MISNSRTSSQPLAKGLAFSETPADSPTPCRRFICTWKSWHSFPYPSITVTPAGLAGSGAAPKSTGKVSAVLTTPSVSRKAETSGCPSLPHGTPERGACRMKQQRARYFHPWLLLLLVLTVGRTLLMTGKARLKRQPSKSSLRV